MPANSATVSHYESLLGPVYTWMIGGLEAAVERNRVLFERLGLGRAGGEPGVAGPALDVGAGPGPQSLALAERGFRVTALEPSATLLGELQREAGARRLPVQALCEGAPLEERHAGPFEAITCMTDTLVSLPDAEAARAFIADAARRLVPGGRLVLTWRDMTALPQGDARFLPVRSDSERILTCFLEPVDAAYVRVHDLLHEREGGGFAQRVSSYLKLRLGPELVEEWLATAGLAVDVRHMDGGMLLRVARRPA